ncbi:MarR family winged helix-turn-helix transcriptional regulator [Geodermatophilus sp. CPCC 206100]|uniref:MarR family winged helix-turn-helix transcriptional regulator n=1 Tax=Geodermatophilus sp. CPCC 206100 TaxID=3020054 RepID=UPI003AFFE8EC
MPRSNNSAAPPAAGAAVRLRGAIARIDRFLSREGAGGLTRTQVSVLFGLVRFGEQRIGDLAEREGVNPTMLSRVVARLDDDGLIQRVPDARDGRAVLVAATPAGEQLVARLQHERARAIAGYLEGLEAEDARRLEAALPLLEGLADHLHQRRTGGCGRSEQDR